MIIEDSQRDAWFKEFDELGEEKMRLAWNVDEWRNMRSKQSCAAERLRHKDMERSSRSLRWSRYAAYAAVAGLVLNLVTNEDKIRTFILSIWAKL